MCSVAMLLLFGLRMETFILSSGLYTNSSPNNPSITAPLCSYPPGTVRSPDAVGSRKKIGSPGRLVPIWDRWSLASKTGQDGICNTSKGELRVTLSREIYLLPPVFTHASMGWPSTRVHGVTRQDPEPPWPCGGGYFSQEQYSTSAGPCDKNID